MALLPMLLTMLLLGALLVGAGFACARLVEHRKDIDLQDPASALLTGWALLCVVGVVCAVTGLRLTVPAVAVGMAGVAGYLVDRNAAEGLARLAFAWLLLLPLLAIASIIPPTMSDEFPALLPYAKGLLATDMFPDQTRPNPWTSKPEYPPALPLIGYAAARFGSIDVGYPAKMFNVLLAGAFGLALAALIARRTGTLAAIAIGVALASVLNPFFDPRYALSAYNDTPTGLALALCVAASWRALREPRSHWTLHAAAAAIVVIMLRETSLVLVVALAAGLLACRRPRLAAAITLPALVTFAPWRLYIVTAGLAPTMTVKPFAAWDWSAPLLMLRVLFVDRLANNPVLGIAGAGLALIGVLALIWIVRSGTKRMRALFVLAGTISVTWCAFLLWAYAAVFSNEAETANSAWRYFSQIGPLCIYALVAAVVHAMPARAAIAGRRTALITGGIACLVPLLVPLVTAAHWRVDCRFPDMVAARGAVRAIAKQPLAGEPIAVVNPDEPGWYAELLDYELGRKVHSAVGYKQAEQVPPQGYRLDLSRLDRDRMRRDGVVPQIELARREGNDWKPLLTLASTKPPACGAAPFERWDFTQPVIAPSR